MKISKGNSESVNLKVFEEARCKYAIDIPTAVIDFLTENNGGKPEKKYIESREDSYSIRRFLSLDPKSEYYIEKPMDYFLGKTKKKIIPIAVDDSSNYFCVNIETGKVYYWVSESDEYYMISKGLEGFCALFN